MKARSLGMTAIAGSVIAVGAPIAGLAQQEAFEGAYKGSLDCEETPSRTLRTSLAMIVRNGRITASIDLFDINANRQFTSELATGTVRADGTFYLGDTAYTRVATFRGAYTGAFSTGIITGTQVWTRLPPVGDGVTRFCYGTFEKVGSPGP
jgi:hypothetical protein